MSIEEFVRDANAKIEELEATSDLSEDGRKQLAYSRLAVGIITAYAGWIEKYSEGDSKSPTAVEAIDLAWVMISVLTEIIANFTSTIAAEGSQAGCAKWFISKLAGNVAARVKAMIEGSRAGPGESLH